MATISMRCKECGGTLDVNDDQNVMFCPYCGSKELLLESDEVRKARLKYDAYRDISHDAKSIERQMKLDEYEQEHKKLRNANIHTIVGLAMIALFMFLMHSCLHAG